MENKILSHDLYNQAYTLFTSKLTVGVYYKKKGPKKVTQLQQQIPFSADEPSKTVTSRLKTNTDCPGLCTLSN